MTGKSVTPERLLQMSWAFAPPLLIEAAVKNGVFDRLDAGPKTLRELAAATGASERGLRALCDALVAIQLLERRGDRYELTPESSTFLVSTKPAYHGALLSHVSEQVLPHWLRLAESVRTGRPDEAVNRQETGTEFFSHLVEAIFPLGFAASTALGRHLGVDAAKAPLSVLDLAAGSGVWGIAIAKLSPHVRVTAVDWEGVLKVTRRVAERNGVAERFTFVAGDLASAPLGRGHRIAVLGQILHSEGEARARALLRRTYDALASGGTIAIAEFVPDDDRRGPPMPLFFAVNMLVHTDAGDVFTFREIASWLSEAGFRDARRLEAPAPSPLILATRP